MVSFININILELLYIQGGVFAVKKVIPTYCGAFPPLFPFFSCFYYGQFMFKTMPLLCLFWFDLSFLTGKSLFFLLCCILFDLSLCLTCLFRLVSLLIFILLSLCYFFADFMFFGLSLCLSFVFFIIIFMFSDCLYFLFIFMFL